MTVISIIGLIVCVHSIFTAIRVLADPAWYYARAAAAGVQPNPGAAVATKLLMACVGGGVAWYFY